MQAEMETPSTKYNVITYIAGFIVRRCRKLCSDCGEVLTGTLQEDNMAHTFLANKNYAGAKHGLIVPSQEAFDAIKAMETQYTEIVKKHLHFENVSLSIASVLMKLPQTEVIANDCSCGTKLKFVKLFVRMRLHHTLKCNNQRFKESGAKRNRKVLKFDHL